MKVPLTKLIYFNPGLEKVTLLQTLQTSFKYLQVTNTFANFSELGIFKYFSIKYNLIYVILRYAILKIYSRCETLTVQCFIPDTQTAYTNVRSEE